MALGEPGAGLPWPCPSPGWCSSTGSEHDLNRLGITLGAGAQANTDEGPEAVTKADTETARHLGRRVATVAKGFAGVAR